MIQYNLSYVTTLTSEQKGRGTKIKLAATEDNTDTECRREPIKKIRNVSLIVHTSSFLPTRLIAGSPKKKLVVNRLGSTVENPGKT